MSDAGITGGRDFCRYPAFIAKLIAINQWTLLKPLDGAATTYIDEALSKER